MRRLLLFVLTLSLPLPLASADWPRFRGVNGKGVADGPVPLDLADAKNLLWKVPIPGKGVSSPIVVGGKIYLQTASTDGKTRSMVCLDAATGKPVWAKDVPGTTAHTHAKNSLASSTPACDGEMVYGVFWDGSVVGLRAFDLAGEQKWEASFGGYVSQHGPGFSPVVHNGLVYVNVDDDKHAELLAFDTKTGDKKWTAARKSHRASYTPPFILERPGKPAELVLGTTTAITAYEPATGKVVWNYPVVWEKGDMPLRVIGQPVYAAGLVVMACGDGGGSRYAVAIDPKGGTPAKVWEHKKDIPYVPCMLVKDDLLFWITDKPGMACCADAKTGKLVWNERLFAKDVTSSPVMVGDKILMIAENGDVVVVKASKTFEEVHRANLGEAVLASPAIADGKLYVRGASHLFCFGKK